MSIIRKYGWKRQKKDHRDFVLAPRTTIDNLPPVVDLRSGMPAVFDQGQLGSCHDTETEVLTSSGWKLFKDLLASDLLASVDSSSKKVHFVLPKRVIKLPYKGKMIDAHGKTKDFSVTPDHKMLIAKWNQKDRKLSNEYSFVNASDLGWYCGLMTGVETSNIDIEKITINKIDSKVKLYQIPREMDANAWFGLLGLYLAEGTMIPGKKMPSSKYVKGSKIQIAACKPREREYCLSLFKKLNINPCILKDRFTFADKQIYEAYKSYGLEGVKAPFKFIPEFIFNLGPKNMQSVLDGHFNGDGCMQENHISHYTSSEKLADGLQRLILLSGGWSTVNKRDPRASVMKDGRVINGKYPEFRVSRHFSINLSIDTKGEIITRDYEGIVYCAEVEPYHTLITRRNGKMLISGNCSANAWSAAFKFTDTKEGNKTNDSFIPSRLFIYYNERVLENTVNEDSGAMLRDGAKTLADQGACDEANLPYDVSKFTAKPSDQCYTEALDHQALTYFAVNQDLNTMKRCLADGYPIVIGFSVYESFEGPDVAKTGVVNLPKRFEKNLGGHAVIVIGYNDHENRFLVRNSWGDNWGMCGNFTIPYGYLTNPNLASDFWTLRLVEIPVAPVPPTPPVPPTL